MLSHAVHGSVAEAGCCGEVQILVVEPHEVVRRGVDEMLRMISSLGETTVGTVTTAASLDSAVAILESSPQDIILFPSDVGSGAFQLLAEAADSGLLVALIRDTDPAELAAASKLAVQGFLLQPDITVATLERALVGVLRGEVPIPPVLARTMMGERRTPSTPPPPKPILSPREGEVLELLVNGLSNKLIARRLGISEHGAKRHVANVLMKLNCPNRTTAVARVVRDNLLGA
jgi:two-component system, NarL family, nitrate/nitrite response regulator NarL